MPPPVKAIGLIGASGILGRAVRMAARADGIPIMSFSRDPRSPYFADLGPPARLVSAPLQAIIVCARDADAGSPANHTGLEQLLGLAEAVAERVVLPSSSRVFADGTQGNLPLDPANPSSDYGKEKATLESSAMGRSRRISIVRFGKILDPRGTPFSGWLQGNKPPLSDMLVQVVEPLHAGRELLACALSSEVKIVHCACREATNYAALAGWSGIPLPGIRGGYPQPALLGWGADHSGMDTRSPQSASFAFQQLLRRLGRTGMVARSW